MTVNADNSILVGGPNPAFDGYRVRVRNAPVNTTGFRLEVLDDPSLPDNGPGRAGNGNFVLTEFRVTASDPVGPLPVLLQNPTAQGSQPGFPVRDVIDLLPNTGWADDLTASNNTPPNVAVFETAETLQGGPVTRLTFTLNNVGTCCAEHNLGKFRISATTDDRSTFADGLENGGDVEANWTVLTPETAASANGATLTVQPDGSVLAGGFNPQFDTYTITLDTTLSGITGFRLEALDDPTLPDNGPGRAGNGNFVLGDFSVTAQFIVPEPGAGALVGAMTGAALLLRRRRG
jgi:hypothetical protein